MYDIIGDIYGHVTLLRNLLAVMDYSNKAGGYGFTRTAQLYFYVILLTLTPTS